MHNLICRILIFIITCKSVIKKLLKTWIRCIGRLLLFMIISKISLGWRWIILIFLKVLFILSLLCLYSTTFFPVKTYVFCSTIMTTIRYRFTFKANKFAWFSTLNAFTLHLILLIIFRY